MLLMKSKLLPILLIAFAFILPIFTPEAYLYVIGLAYLFAIAVVSWDIITGYTGQVNLGHTVFIGLGAYTSALLQVPSRIGLSFKVPIFLSILTGGVVSAVFGFIIGSITLRLRGYYFALVTAVLPLVFMQTVFIWSDVFGGEEGFSIGFENAFAKTVIGRYYIALIILIVCTAIMWLIVRSNIGLKFKAIREDEQLAESIGIDTTKYKVLAFVISAFFAGISGASIVHYRITVSPDLYDIPLMLLITLSAVMGGLGTIYGPLLGGIFIYLAKNWWIKEITKGLMFPIDEIVLYILLIAFGILMPEGLYVEIRKRFKKSNNL